MRTLHWHLTETYRVRQAVLYNRQVSDDLMEIGIQDYGSVFQEVSTRLSRHNVLFTAWRPLHRHEWAKATEWYIRRGWRYWPWQGWWWASSAYEFLNLNLCFWLISLKARNLILLSWRNVWRVWTGKEA